MILSEAAGRTADLLPVAIHDADVVPRGQHIQITSLASLQGQVVNLSAMLMHRLCGHSGRPARLAIWVRRWAISLGAAVWRWSRWWIRGARWGRRGADQVLEWPGDSITPTVTLSLRAWIRTTYAFERLTDDPGRAIAEAAELAARARQAAPFHATALAANSVIEAYLDRHQIAYGLARQAVMADGQNPLARLSLSRARAGIDRLEQLASEAQAGLDQALSSLNPASTWGSGSLRCARATCPPPSITSRPCIASRPTTAPRCAFWRRCVTRSRTRPARAMPCAPCSGWSRISAWI
ncbi:hypothetical protein [Paracoccus sediminilitoris]|uniref:hypothetical protein n=1 Tax=Paracoccus sediminilitoris TaxID=2202419 RepID=UPI0011B9463E|nr:hypothetical protein [Paracoccus sediminilitoris]